jgi:hypothetical protein
MRYRALRYLSALFIALPASGLLERIGSLTRLARIARRGAESRAHVILAKAGIQ